MLQSFVNEWDLNSSAPKTEVWDHRVVIGGGGQDLLFRLNSLKVDAKNIAEKEPLKLSGGGAANNAIVQRKVDAAARITLLAHVADDDVGRSIRRHMADHHIAMPLAPLPGFTSMSLILSESNGKSTIITARGPRAVPIPLPEIEAALRGASACCLVAHSVNEQIRAILDMARSQGIPVFIGLGSAQIYQLGYSELKDILAPGAELAICNRPEAAHLTGSNRIEVQLNALRFAGQVRTAVVTNGSGGIHAACNGKNYHVPAYRAPGRKVIDEVGAGDAAQATIVSFLLLGYPLPLALLAGARQGFEACTAFGATSQLVDGPFLKAFVEQAKGRKVA